VFDSNASYAKKLLVLGIALLIVGSVIVVALTFFFQTEIVTVTSVDMTTTGSYLSDRFRSESGYWLDLSISSNASSTIHVKGQTVGEVFKVDGTTYVYTVPIHQGDVYQIQVENKANYYDWGTFRTVYVNNHISGNFYLKRSPVYLFPLMTLGGIFIAIGIVVIPVSLYVEHNARQRAESIFKCQRCGRNVHIGLETCPFCKLDLTKYWVTCKYCGKFYDSHLEKCPKCGAESEV